MFDRFVVDSELKSQIEAEIWKIIFVFVWTMLDKMEPKESDIKIFLKVEVREHNGPFESEREGKLLRSHS